MNIFSKLQSLIIALALMVFSFSILISPVLVFAQDSGPKTDIEKWDGSINITRNSSGNITEIISRVILWLLGVLALVATAVIIYAGVLLTFNGGNEKRVAQAKSTLLWAIVGLVVAIGAFAMVTIIQEVIG